MFWILYILSAAFTLTGLYQHNYPVLIGGVIIYLILNAWREDRERLATMEDKINKLPTKDQILTEANKKAEEFNKLSWYQKIIFISAFNSGVEFILKKFK